MNVAGRFLIFAFLFFILSARPASALILINEILADPPTGALGDANGDGVTSSTQDEFIEILNMSGSAADVSGWSIADSVKTRHVFGAGTLIAPYEFLVVFGGDTPNLPDVNWQIASTGTLHLTNTGDAVFLFDADSVLADSYVFTEEANRDQSLVRFPEGDLSGFVLHSSLVNTSRFSPGTTVDGKTKCLPAVPEAATVLYFGFGWVAVAFVRRRQKQFAG